MIEIKDVSYRYDMGEHEIEALSHVTLSVADGEFVALLGSNGSGKSTLARHMNGLLVPSSGTVTVDGMSTAGTADIWRIRERVGLVFQNPDNQIIAGRVAEDVAFGPENLGLDPDEIEARVSQALALVDMSGFAEHDPHVLSGGQKQRVTIAGALAMHPAHLILDEATSMLDPQGSRDVLGTLVKLNRELGVTVIHITHNPDEALCAGRVIVLADGAVYLDGAPRDVFADADTLAGVGIGIPKAQHIAIELAKAGLSIPTTLYDIDELVDALCC